MEFGITAPYAAVLVLIMIGLQIILLYDALLRHEPTPVVRLNRAAALAGAGALGPAEGELMALGDELDRYQPYHAARADVLSRLGRDAEAIEAYGRAIDLAGTEAERVFLRTRRNDPGCR